jgi:hypothetical protein
LLDVQVQVQREVQGAEHQPGHPVGRGNRAGLLDSACGLDQG